MRNMRKKNIVTGTNSMIMRTKSMVMHTKRMVMRTKSIMVQKKNLLISMTLKRLRPALSFILFKDFVLRKDMHIMELNQNCHPKNFF